MQNLKLGSIGTDVITLQTILIQKGYNCGSIDGSFGNKTLEQVKLFQKDNGLIVDGLVGPATWAALLKTTTTTTQPIVTYTTFNSARILKTEPNHIELIVANKKFIATTSSNITNGTYFWQGKPNGILINNGNILCNNASHAWRGYPQSVLYYNGNEVNIKRIKSAAELGKVDWAIGGCGMIAPYGYSPTKEGFNNQYADILRTTNKTVIGSKNNIIYSIVVPNISHGSLLTLLKQLNLDYAISLDGGGSTCMRANSKNIISSDGRIINNWVVLK